MRHKHLQPLYLAATLTMTATGIAHADDSWERYRFITKFFMYMDACNAMGQSPRTKEFMDRLNFKIESFGYLHQFKNADMDALSDYNRTDTLKVMKSGWLDGPQCHNTGELLSKTLKDDAFWK